MDCDLRRNIGQRIYVVRLIQSFDNHGLRTSDSDARPHGDAEAGDAAADRPTDGNASSDCDADAATWCDAAATDAAATDAARSGRDAGIRKDRRVARCRVRRSV